MNRYFFSNHAHHRHIGSEITILDEKADKYLLLNRIQTLQLIAFMKYGTPSKLGMHLYRTGLIVIEDGTAVEPDRPAGEGSGLLRWNHCFHSDRFRFNPGTLILALFTLVGIKSQLINKGLHCSLEKCRQLYCPKAKPKNRKRDTVELASNLGKHIKLISPFLPFKVKCLEFSLTLFHLLIKKGVEPSLVIGFQRYDFLSHAWIEVDGIVIMDEPDLSVKLNEIVRITS